MGSQRGVQRRSRYAIRRAMTVLNVDQRFCSRVSAWRRCESASRAFSSAPVAARRLSTGGQPLRSLVLRLPLLHGGQGVADMLVGVHRRVLINDLAVGRDDIRGTIGI